MSVWQEFHGPNAGYVLELFERYQKDPSSVDENTRAFFEQWSPVEAAVPVKGPTAGVGELRQDLHKAVGVANLAQAIRAYGHLAAQLDPLGSAPRGDPALEPGYHGLAEEDLANFPADLVGVAASGPDSPEYNNALEAIQALRRTYSQTIGFDFSHLSHQEERAWFQQVVETGMYGPHHSPIPARPMLERLTQVETFERFLHRSFPGKTRFSIEGLDLMVPILDEIIRAGVDEEICMVFLAMAHRGRLNVLHHVQQKAFTQILAEFKDPGINFTTRVESGWTGDVKYHKGALRAVDEDKDEVVDLVICMPPNPSHLEHINPVVVGMARAADTQMNKPGAPRFFPKASIPIMIHGDASFPGQGVVAETLNLSRLPGYQTAGTIHIIANNQLGYTATTQETRSTLYASDLAKGFKIPVIYVNADDPEAGIEAARIAFAYRSRFQKDVVIDLIGYRRYGHNEGDEPSFTQPLLYDLIRGHPTVREIWAQKLVERGEVEAGFPDELVKAEMGKLQEIYESLQPEEALDEDLPEPAPPGAARQVQTAVPLDRLAALNRALQELPEDFQINRKLERGRQRRATLFDSNEQEAQIDWATAEELAFATILQDGTPIRLTGEDAIRGTFSHRHAVLYDVEEGTPYIPLQEIPQADAAFEIANTPVTENAMLGFEFGYNVFAPERLVIWEAQYGDFINAAQAMIDEFLVSARAKWGQTPSLVLLLPHGNEGQGPDHSSARPERFLQAAADNNLRIANPTTAAQYFHLLRRQAALLEVDPLPLVVLTPKGLLRHPMVSSELAAFSDLAWQPVIDDGPAAGVSPEEVRRLLLCSGRVYVDLASFDKRDEASPFVIARLEQLAPFPEDEVEQVLARYPNLEEVVWVQEEPRNMGAWEFVRPRLNTILSGRVPLQFIGRPASSSPAEGSANWYAANQRALIEEVFRAEEDKIERGLLVERG